MSVTSICDKQYYNMDNSSINEPLESNATSLHGHYTNFDDWVIKYTTYYKRSIKTKENTEKSHSTDNIILEDIFVANILLRQRHKGYSASCHFNNFKETDTFFYDHILFKILDKNVDRSLICRFIPSKL